MPEAWQRDAAINLRKMNLISRAKNSRLTPCPMKTKPRRLFLFTLYVLAGLSLAAEVTRVDVAQRTDVGGSGYEKITGIVHFAVDPRDPRNRVITDLDKAPVNAAGRVEFSADFHLLRPREAARSNGVAIIDVPNRGGKPLLGGINRAAISEPGADPDVGDGFLMRHGFTLAWVGWQFDVRRQNGALGIAVPAAAGITGLVHASFTPNNREPEQTVTDLAPYMPIDATGTDTTLTVRDGPFGRPKPIARANFKLQGNVVTLPDGFEPGRTYELSYRAANPPIAGLGLAAFRDFATWIRHAPDALAPARYTIAFGQSQSGRFLREFLYDGFNTDERGNQVFDGMMIHIAGGSRIDVNQRWSTVNSVAAYAATEFPFATISQRDPISGRTEGLLDNDRAREHQPKIFFTNTPVEYWGGGRAAALIHTSPDGRTDLALPENQRAYLLSGTQHGPGPFPPQATTGQLPVNPVNYWWAMRSLLLAMDRWVREDTPPPASQYPRLADGTLAPAVTAAFPAIPGVRSPRTISPGHQGNTPVPLLVPQVDEDGNDRAGIRLPDIAVPLATYTGWNFRNAAIGGTGDMVALMGSSLPFPKTPAVRAATHDPRKSIEERYGSKEQYLARVRDVAERLVKNGYVLTDDVPLIVKRAEQAWDTYR